MELFYCQNHVFECLKPRNMQLNRIPLMGIPATLSIFIRNEHIFPITSTFKTHHILASQNIFFCDSAIDCFHHEFQIGHFRETFPENC